jgi:hypothetical protein
MILRFIPAWRRSSWLPLLATTMVLALASAPARADLNITVESVTATGTTGTFDVTLTNTGPNSVSVGAFSFEISAPAPVTFTGVTTGTTTVSYIFGTNSAFGPDIQTPGTTLPSGTLDATDAFSAGPGISVGSGATVGLGHVAFTLTGTLTAPVPVSLSGFPATSLTDSSGNNLEVTSLINGTISPSGVTPVPEPATLGPAALGALALAWYLTRFRRRRPAVA